MVVEVFLDLVWLTDGNSCLMFFCSDCKRFAFLNVCLVNGFTYDFIGGSSVLNKMDDVAVDTFEQ